MASSTGLAEIADREGFVVAFPDGTGRRSGAGTWNAGGCCGYARASGVEDVAFAEAMIDRVHREHGVDLDRVYVTGHSNGGMLAHRVAMERPDRIAGAAVVAGATFEGGPVPSAPVPLLMIHARDDETVPFEGGESPRRAVRREQVLPYRPAARTAALWAEAGGCDARPQSEQAGIVTTGRFESCQAEIGVVLVALGEGGHPWPDGNPVNAAELAWAFFEAHP